MKALYTPGQQITTKIVAISEDSIFLDLGLKSEGILAKSELADENGVVSVKEGDSITVYFLAERQDELYFTTRVGGKDAGKDMLESAYKSQIPVEGHVTQEIKGGFEVMIGSTRAFCPYSQMGYRDKKEPKEYVGQHLRFRIQEYKNEGKNIVLSNRILLEEEAQTALNKLASELTVGTTVIGKIKSIESYGAFVDINGFQALLPISEISHARVNDVHDKFSVGQEVTAQIIKADWAHEKVSLSTKALEADPWDNIEKKFPAGTKIEGKISRVADFGLFVNIAPGIDGLVHISKLKQDRNTNIKKVYKAGSDFSVIVEKIDTVEKRISLSPVVSTQEEDTASEYLLRQKDDGETYNPFAALLKNKNI